MKRYILIDRNSGYIFGDTADRWWRMDEDHPVGPLEAAESLDRALMINTSGWSYALAPRHDARATYDVYTADDDVSPIWDGQDQEIIDMVVNQCTHIDSVIRY